MKGVRLAHEHKGLAESAGARGLRTALRHWRKRRMATAWRLWLLGGIDDDWRQVSKLCRSQ